MPSSPIRTVKLVGKTVVAVPDSDLTVRIESASHKIRAPVVGVSILVERGSDKTEVGWTIEEGEISGSWEDVAGRRYDEDSGDYVEEQIPGWQVRLDSIDDTNAGGSPSAITVSFKPAS